MCLLQDMAPYVPLLMPELKAALIDPLPEVRATAAKALGSLLKGMGQQYFEDVLPWLLETLKSEGSSVERSGAAQGLAEVLAVLGPAHVEALLPDILAGTKSKSPFVREGHLTLFKFLPLAIPQTFQVVAPRPVYRNLRYVVKICPECCRMVPLSVGQLHCDALSIMCGKHLNLAQALNSTTTFWAACT